MSKFQLELGHAKFEAEGELAESIFEFYLSSPPPLFLEYWYEYLTDVPYEKEDFPWKKSGDLGIRMKGVLIKEENKSIYEYTFSSEIPYRITFL